MQQHYSVAIVSNGSGAVEDAFLRPHAGGWLTAIYVEIGTLATGAVDFAITDQRSGAAIITLTNVAASGWYVPSLVLNDATGTARTAYTTGVPVDGPVKIVTTGAGNSKAGTLHFYFGGV